MFRSIPAYEVYDQIVNLNSSKSTIGTPVKCVKLACNYIYQALAEVYNQYLEQGIVTPIDKGGDISDASNFRPISTLSVFAQILEKLVYKH